MWTTSHSTRPRESSVTFASLSETNVDLDEQGLAECDVVHVAGGRSGGNDPGGSRTLHRTRPPPPLDGPPSPRGPCDKYIFTRPGSPTGEQNFTATATGPAGASTRLTRGRQPYRPLSRPPSGGVRFDDAAMSATATLNNEPPERRRKLARDRRREIPRSSLGVWKPPPGRPDPIDVLRRQEQHRIEELLPIRHQRMSASPFAFLRGAAAVMAPMSQAPRRQVWASRLAVTPTSSTSGSSPRRNGGSCST